MTEFIPPKHIVAASGLIRNASGQVLMVESPKRGWEFPSGQVEEGESLIRALQRETIEETGVTIRLGVPLDSITYEAGNAGLKKVDYWGGVVLDSVPRAPDAERPGPALPDWPRQARGLEPPLDAALRRRPHLRQEPVALAGSGRNLQ